MNTHTHVQEEDAHLHASRNTSVSYLENISNAIHLQSHYYGSVIIQNSQRRTSSLHTVGNSPSCQFGPLNTVHGEENWHHEKCMRLERERWARVSQSTDAAQRPRISRLCVCVGFHFKSCTYSSCGAESFDSVSHSLPESELNGRVSSCAKLWTWRHLSHYPQYTTVKPAALGMNASFKPSVGWTLPPCISSHPLVVYFCYFLAFIFLSHTFFTHILSLFLSNTFGSYHFFCEPQWHEKQSIRNDAKYMIML